MAVGSCSRRASAGGGLSQPRRRGRRSPGMRRWCWGRMSIRLRGVRSAPLADPAGKAHRQLAGRARGGDISITTVTFSPADAQKGAAVRGAVRGGGCWHRRARSAGEGHARHRRGSLKAHQGLSNTTQRCGRDLPLRKPLLTNCRVLGRCVRKVFTSCVTY